MDVLKHFRKALAAKLCPRSLLHTGYKRNALFEKLPPPRWPGLWNSVQSNAYTSFVGVGFLGPLGKE